MNSNIHQQIRAEFKSLGWTEGEGMIWLKTRDKAIISDECLAVEDIWVGDAEKALEALVSIP